MKDYLDRAFWKWQAGDRSKRLVDFANYLGVEYGALSAWMNGTRKPKKENVAKLAEKLGLETYDVAGYARPDNGAMGDIAPNTLSLFVGGWKRFPPDLQRDLLDLVENATEEEAERIFRDAVKTWMLRRDLSENAESSASTDEKPPVPEKGAKKQQARLRKRVGAA